jgi:hypothetical protein
MGKQGASESIKFPATLGAAHLFEGIKSPANPLPVQSLATMRAMYPPWMQLLKHPEPAAMFVQEAKEGSYILG